MTHRADISPSTAAPCVSAFFSTPTAARSASNCTRQGGADRRPLRQPGPGRLPAGPWHRRLGLPFRGRSQQRRGPRARRAVHGQRRPEHQRQPVLHHPRPLRLARRQAARCSKAWTWSTASVRATRSSRSRSRATSRPRSTPRPTAWRNGTRSSRRDQFAEGLKKNAAIGRVFRWDGVCLLPRIGAEHADESNRCMTRRRLSIRALRVDPWQERP
jgi:hypothetical protein